jgi:hypothetical protein
MTAGNSGISGIFQRHEGSPPCRPLQGTAGQENLQKTFFYPDPPRGRPSGLIENTSHGTRATGVLCQIHRELPHRYGQTNVRQERFHAREQEPVNKAKNADYTTTWVKEGVPFEHFSPDYEGIMELHS